MDGGGASTWKIDPTVPVRTISFDEAFSDAIANGQAVSQAMMTAKFGVVVLRFVEVIGWRSVERFAVQRWAKPSAADHPLQRLYGFDSRAAKRCNFSDEAVPVSRHRQRFRNLSRADMPWLRRSSKLTQRRSLKLTQA
jgi:hypothetical protein